MTNTRVVAGLMIALFVPLTWLSGCGPFHTFGGVAVHGESAHVSIAFSDQDIALIRDYYRANLPPGLAKKGKLPPGLAKKSTLPPGLQREALPAVLEAKLSPLPDGYVRVRVGFDVVLLEQRTRVVIDVVKDIGS
jgi:hypothetical protein